MKHQSKYEWGYLFLLAAWLILSECEQRALPSSAVRIGLVWTNFAAILVAFCISVCERRTLQKHLKEQAGLKVPPPNPKGRDWNLVFVVLLGVSTLLMLIKLLYIYL